MIHINESLLNETTKRAEASSRLRTNHNFHQTASDTLQRMLNALEPGTYVCPHKHQFPDKREAFIILRGKLLVVEFDTLGEVTDYVVLDASAGAYGVEIAPATYHTIVALSAGTVVYEVKDGPYDVSNDKGFAPWAPMEGDANAQHYLNTLLTRLGF